LGEFKTPFVIRNIDDNKQQLHPRIRSITDILFTKMKLLLSKGLKYNLHYKLNNWIRTIAIETETTIRYVKEIKQNCVRQAIAKTVKHFLRKNTENSTTEKQE
jgi:hypothetical protein